jgi:hypothetical protein
MAVDDVDGCGCAEAHDWPQAISRLKEGVALCTNCGALPLLHNNLGLIYCRSGELKNGRSELLIAKKAVAI